MFCVIAKVQLERAFMDVMAKTTNPMLQNAILKAFWSFDFFCHDLHECHSWWNLSKFGTQKFSIVSFFSLFSILLSSRAHLRPGAEEDFHHKLWFWKNNYHQQLVLKSLRFVSYSPLASSHDFAPTPPQMADLRIFLKPRHTKFFNMLKGLVVVQITMKTIKVGQDFITGFLLHGLQNRQLVGISPSLPKL